MANRKIDVELSLIDNFTQTFGKSLQAMTSMSKQGIKIGKDIEKAGKQIASVGSSLTKSITLPIVGVAAAAVKTAADFEKSMSNVHAIMGKNYDDSLVQFAQKLGATTAWSAQEVAQAMQYTGMAGWTAEQNIAGLKGILDLASASGTDLALTSDIMTDAISAFGYTADESARFADVMTAACTSANVSVETLGESYKYCGALAGTMGYEVDQVTTALAAMGNQGIKGSQAGTTLKNAISNMAAPTKEMKIAMDALGISLTEKDGTMKSFESVIENVRNAFSGLGEAEKAAYAKQIFGKTAMAGMLAIINTSTDDYNALAQAIDSSGGAADKAANTQLDNLSGQITLLKSAVEGAAIAFGNKLLPHLKKAAEFAQDVMDRINGLSDAQVDNIIKWAGIAAAIGPAILVFGKVVTAVGTGIRMFNQFGVALKAAHGIMGLIASPVGIVVMAIAALVAVVLIVRRHMDVFRSSMTALQPVFESIRGHIQSIISKAQEIWTVIGPIAAKIADVLGVVITAAVGGLVGYISSSVETILTVVDSIMTVLQGVIDFVTGVFTGNWERAWNGVGEIFSGTVDGFSAMFKGAINGIIGAINGFLGGLNGMKIPDWIPGIGGKTFNMPVIPQLATGTDNWIGGIAQVNERGGEIIDLPSGSRVYPHDKSIEMARQKAQTQENITIAKLADQIIIREEADIDRIGEEFVRRIRMASKNRGAYTVDANMA